MNSNKVDSDSLMQHTASPMTSSGNEDFKQDHTTRASTEQPQARSPPMAQFRCCIHQLQCPQITPSVKITTTTKKVWQIDVLLPSVRDNKCVERLFTSVILFHFMLCSYVCMYAFNLFICKILILFTRVHSIYQNCLEDNYIFSKKKEKDHHSWQQEMFFLCPISAYFNTFWRIIHIQHWKLK